MENLVTYKTVCPLCGKEIRYSPDKIYSIGAWGDGSDIEVTDCPSCNQQITLTGLPYERSEATSNA